MTELVDVPIPFGEPVPPVPLAASPLIAVIAQVRFPSVVSVGSTEFIGPFQERIRPWYPVLRQEREVNLLLTAQGIRPGGDAAPVWRFLDATHEPAWKVSLASTFVAVETSAYGDRADFLARFRQVLDALAATVAPTVCDRVGVRYVDRVVLDEPVELASLVRPEVVGAATVDCGDLATLVHHIADAEFRLDGATLHGRWGLLPPGAQIDPFHGDAVDAPSWFLDLDMYEANPGGFDIELLTARAASFAERIYRFFRWAVCPQLLRRFGGAL